MRYYVIFRGQCWQLPPRRYLQFLLDRSEGLQFGLPSYGRPLNESPDFVQDYRVAGRKIYYSSRKDADVIAPRGWQPSHFRAQYDFRKSHLYGDD